MASSYGSRPLKPPRRGSELRLSFFGLEGTGTEEKSPPIDAMMTKYSCYEHSQSMEAPVDVPDPQELEIDVQRMIDWHKEFTNRPAA